MRALSIMLGAIALASCTVEPPQAPPVERPAAAETPAPTTLAGQWDVSLLDGEEAGETLVFSADGREIWWEPACAGARRSYRIEGDRIAISGPPRGGPQEAGGGGFAVCTIGIPPQLSAYMNALEGVDTVQSAPAGAVRLHGDGLVLLMTPRESDAQAQAAYPASIVGEWRVAGLDGKALDMPIGLTVSITPQRITYPTVCGGYAWNYSYSQGGLTLQQMREPDPSCLASATAPREVFEVAGALNEALGVSRTAENGIELSGGERSVTLFSQ